MYICTWPNLKSWPSPSPSSSSNCQPLSTAALCLPHHQSRLAKIQTATVCYCLEKASSVCLQKEAHSPRLGTEKLVKQPPAATSASPWPSPGPVQVLSFTHLTAHRLPEGHLSARAALSVQVNALLSMSAKHLAVLKILLEINSTTPPNNNLMPTSDVLLKCRIINSLTICLCISWTKLILLFGFPALSTDRYPKAWWMTERLLRAYI